MPVNKETKNIIKLFKCPTDGCGKAFYVKVNDKGNFKLKCPYCQNDVIIKVNGDVNIYEEKDDTPENKL